MSSKMHTKPNRSSLSTPLEETAKKHSLELKQLEEMTSVEQSQDKAASVEPNLEYNENDEQPELQFRTYIALAAMFFMPLPVVSSLFGPPSVLSYIGADLGNTAAESWILNSLALVATVLSPVVASASDSFQARKPILLVCSTLSFIGASIAPGSKDIYRLIGAQILLGFGLAIVPITYAIFSEILPKRWRPIAQAVLNLSSMGAGVLAPLTIGKLTQLNPHTGWRTFFWIEMALWGVCTILIFIGYRPPKRHTLYDHLSFWQKLGRLDFGGIAFLMSGLALFLTGLNLGGSFFPWTAVQVLAPLVIGIALLIGFSIYEWCFISTGILHHDLFKGGKNKGRIFALCSALMFIEGMMLFSYIVFYPLLTSTLYESDPFLQAARSQPFYIATGFGSIIFGCWSTNRRTIRSPLFVGYLIFTGGLIGLATMEPSSGLSAIIFAGLVGFGYGVPLILIIVGVQLSTPHHLIATATAVVTSGRTMGATVITAISSAALTSRLNDYIPSYIASAALAAGLPPSSVSEFVGALAEKNTAALLSVPNINATIIAAGEAAASQAFADAIRVVFIIGAALGTLSCIICLFIGDLSDAMNYHVDAPVEVLHAKYHSKAGDEEA